MSAAVNSNVTYLPTAKIRQAVRRFPTPFFIYEEKRIRANCERFRDTFRRYFPTFEPLYAVKANANPALLKIIFSEGFGADASSEAEAWIARKLNVGGMYTGNYTTAQEFQFVLRERGFQLNLDDISMLPVIRRLGMPKFLSFRVNPGISRGGMKSLFLAGANAKFGVPLANIITAFQRARALGVRRFGIHAMTGSNVLDETYFAAVAAKLLTIAGKLKRETGITIERLNIGGGFGVPYRPEQKDLDLDLVARSLRKVFDTLCASYNLNAPILMAEPGRWIMANTGWLIGQVHVIKKSHKKFIGIDAGMNDLPRPAIYGAYHHITVLEAARRRKETVNVVGRLCENNDQFAQNRLLPNMRLGDFLAIHHAGAHAYAMGHNYNNRLRSAEYLCTPKGVLRQIRRAETIPDLFRASTIPTPIKKKGRAGAHLS